MATRRWLHIQGLDNCVQYSLDDRLLLLLVVISLASCYRNRSILATTSDTEGPVFFYAKAKGIQNSPGLSIPTHISSENP